MKMKGWYPRIVRTPLGNIMIVSDTMWGMLHGRKGVYHVFVTPEIAAFTGSIRVPSGLQVSIDKSLPRGSRLLIT